MTVEKILGSILTKEWGQTGATNSRPPDHQWSTHPTELPNPAHFGMYMYSEIPLFRPPKIKTSYLLSTLFAKFKLFFSSFSTPSVPLIRDHLWDSPKGGLNIGILLYM